MTDKELAAQHKGGISCFLVDAVTPGYSAETVLPIKGHVASDCGTITLDDVRVANDRVLGEVD